MNIRINQQKLTRALKLLKGIAGNAKLPDSFKLRVKDNICNAILVNSEFSGSAKVGSVDTEDCESKNIEFNLFSKIIDSLPAVELEMEIGTENITINHTGRVEPIIIQSKVVAAEFKISESKPISSVTIKGDVFKEVSEKAINIVSKGPTTSFYDCIHFTFARKQVMVKGADMQGTRRMVLFSKLVETCDQCTFFIDRDKLKKILETIALGTELIVENRQNTITFAQDGNIIEVRKNVGEYPQIEAYLLAKTEDDFIINKAEIIKSLKVISGVTSKESETVVLEIDGVSCTLGYNSSYVSIKESIKLENTSPNRKANFSTKSLLSAISEFDSESIKVGFLKSSGIIISPGSKCGYIHNIMIPSKVSK